MVFPLFPVCCCMLFLSFCLWCTQHSLSSISYGKHFFTQTVIVLYLVLCVAHILWCDLLSWFNSFGIEPDQTQVANVQTNLIESEREEEIERVCAEIDTKSRWECITQTMSIHLSMSHIFIVTFLSLVFYINASMSFSSTLNRIWIGFEVDRFTKLNWMQIFGQNT